MLHSKRPHTVGQIASAEELAEKLTDHVWTLCTGFEHAGYLYLNDSTSEDGAAEFAIYKASDLTRQIETITFGWIDKDEALEVIQKITSGHYDANAWPSAPPRLDRDPKHVCSRCA